MSKKPTPKQKISKCRTSRRYHAFENKAQKRILNNLKLVVCSHCNELTRSHFACHVCGYYKGRMVIDMSKKLKKVKTVKV